MKKARPSKRRSERSKPVDHELLANFQFHLRHFLSFSEANTRKNGLTSQQYQALLTIRGLSTPHSSMSVRELASFLLIDKDAAAGLVNRMAKVGLLTRSTDPDDGQRILIALTRKGKQKLASVAGANWRELGYRRLSLTKPLKIGTRTSNARHN
jgi:DNA-binding MarR family transcriptional regulator